MPPVITVEHLRKVYGHHVVAVDDVSFEVERGEIFGLLGSERRRQDDHRRVPAGAAHADGGTVRVLGLDPVAPRRRRCAGASAASCRSRACPTT